MRRILSICNSNSTSTAFFITLFLIFGVEFFLAAVLPGKYFSHEVDKILYQIKREPYNGKYVLLGDSVGRQVMAAYGNDKKFAMLATNAAIEMTGQYFLVKRYLKNNPSPQGVIFAGNPTHIARNLEQTYTENYVLRTFTNFDEIAEMFMAKKNPVQTAQSLVYKILPSFKYRLHLQRILLGMSNADIYTGVGRNIGSISKTHHSLGDIIKKYQGKNVSLYHFRKLIKFLTSRGIHFYYIPTPIKEGGTSKSLTKKNRELFKLLNDWKKEGMKITCYENIVEYPEHMFVDTVHFNTAGLHEAQPYIDAMIKKSIATETE